MARALGAQSREIWHVIMGSLSTEPEPSKTWKTHVSAVLLPCSKSSLLCGSHGIQQQSHIKVAWTPVMCVDIAYVYLSCVYTVCDDTCQCV